jgi:hypothetical protein
MDIWRRTISEEDCMQTPRFCKEEIILILAASLMLAGCTPKKYSGGTGKIYDPYKIATAEDLLSMAADTNDYGAHFVLTEDIDLDPHQPGGKVFTHAVISRDINNSGSDFDGVAFSGVFNGAGHKIVNLTINTYGKGNDYLGLFGCIEGGKVKNLGLVNLSIKGGNGSYYIGGLAGCGNRASINNCSSRGAIICGKNCDSVGGLLGDNCFGGIINCLSICDVTCGAYSSNLGGIAGRNIGTINKCRSASIITGGTTSMWLGGLVGSNNGDIRNCSSTGTVTGGSYSYNLGELVGDNPNGTIVNCRSTTTVSAMVTDTGRFLACAK